MKVYLCHLIQMPLMIAMCHFLYFEGKKGVWIQVYFQNCHISVRNLIMQWKKRNPKTKTDSKQHHLLLSLEDMPRNRIWMSISFLKILMLGFSSLILGILSSSFCCVVPMSELYWGCLVPNFKPSLKSQHIALEWETEWASKLFKIKI